LRPISAAASYVDGSFFVHDTHSCGYHYHDKGPEKLGPMPHQNRHLESRAFPQNEI
jgi:hypothetical protein